MSKIDDGGSAFPQREMKPLYRLTQENNREVRPGELLPMGAETSIEYVGSGMSIRDFFAATASTGLIGGGFAIDPTAMARQAYAYADAMLAARKQEVQS